MTPKISVIVPVYNTGEILRDTIESILQQTFTDFELILVDDGSTDISKEICDEYKEKDKRVIVIHQANGGICAARNAGIRMARGEHIAFCDHDDLYSPDFLNKAVAVADRYDVDIVKCGRENRKGLFSEKLVSKKSILLDKTDYRESMIDLCVNRNIGLPFSTIWNGIYKRSLVCDNNLLFDESYKHGGEDFDFNIRLIPFTNRIAVINEVLYIHIIRQSLSTSAKFYDDILNGFLKDFDKVINISKQLDINIKNKISYILLIAHTLQAYTSYSVKMRKDKASIIYRLKTFHNQDYYNTPHSFVDFIRYTGISRQIGYYIIYLLGKSRKYDIIYLLETFKFKVFKFCIS